MGWWKLTYCKEKCVFLTETEQKEISDLIAEGYTEGVIEETPWEQS